ncbi:MAG: ABC transporter permease [Spirochaetaceae bacterium]|nr:MAG: ABC transporter permease [Spirochaetaceae bacterium]
MELEERKGIILGRFVLYIVCGLIFIYLIMPIFVILPISFSSSRFLQFPPTGFSLQWYEKFFSGRNWISATIRSFQVAVLTTVFATILGTLASFAFVRGQFPGKKLLYGMVLSPLIIPVIITAVATYYIFARVRLIGTIWALVFAHTALALPFVVVNVTSTLQGFDITLERAALSLGASRLVTFLRVTFPLIWPGVVSGALFAFITSFDEVVIAIFLTGSRPTLPKQMWDGIRIAINPTISAVSSLLIVFSIILLLSLQLFTGRSMRMRGRSVSDQE